MLPVYLVFLALCKSAITSEDAKVTTPLGDIKGTTLTSRLGKTIYAFRGIRYAQPPVGDLRFKDPIPIGKWDGVLDATADAPACPQITKDPTSEDCLMLNIYTTELPVGGSNPKRPILFFIHPGFMENNSGRSSSYGPHYIADNNIVLVTLNYRLGAFGFLSVGKESPGNYGLKDQVMALKWIRDNIVAFGGDPNSVTLYGNTGGSYSCLHHLVSPMSKGLFHKVLAASGIGMGIYATPKNQLELAKKQARVLSCPDNTPDEIVKCLKTKSAEDIANSMPQLKHFGNEPIVVYLPVVEEDYGQERFLTGDPIEFLKKGQFENVPVIGGSNTYELASRADKMIKNSAFLDELNNNFAKHAADCFAYDESYETSKSVSKELYKFYFNNGKINSDSFINLTNLYTDTVIGYPTHRALTYIAAKSTKPVFYYHYAILSKFSNFLDSNNEPIGAVDGDDLFHVFYMPKFPFLNSSYPFESVSVDKLTQIATLFAKTGDVNAENGKELLNGLVWTPYTTTGKDYFQLNNGSLAMKKNFNADRFDFLEKLFS